MSFEFEKQEIIECRVEGILTSADVFVSRWNNTWHFCRDANDPLDPADETLLYLTAQAVASGLHGRYEQEVMPFLSNQCAILATRAKIIHPLDSAFAVFGDAVVGTIVASYDEPDDALVVTKRTHRPSRRFLGRVFLPGIPDAEVVGGVAESLAGSIAGAFRTLVESPVLVSGETYVAGVFSRLAYTGTPTADFAFAELANVEVDRVVRRQTRRDIKERIPFVGVPPS